MIISKQTLQLVVKEFNKVSYSYVECKT